MGVNEKRTESERRKQPRIPCSTVVIMSCCAGDQLEFEAARLLDCSPEGVCILFHRALPVGSRFLLKVQTAGAKLVSYVIRNCRPHGEEAGVFRIGAAFSRVIGHAEDYRPAALLDALMGEPGSAAGGGGGA